MKEFWSKQYQIFYFFSKKGPWRPNFFGKICSESKRASKSEYKKNLPHAPKGKKIKIFHCFKKTEAKK